MGYDFLDTVLLGVGIVLGAGIVGVSIDRQNDILIERNRIMQNAIAYEHARQPSKEIADVFFEQRVGDEREDLVIRNLDGSELVWEAYTIGSGGLGYRAVDR
jgi:hypothetical protein